MAIKYGTQDSYFLFQASKNSPDDQVNVQNAELFYGICFIIIYITSVDADCHVP